MHSTRTVVRLYIKERFRKLLVFSDDSLEGDRPTILCGEVCVSASLASLRLRPAPRAETWTGDVTRKATNLRCRPW